MSGRTIDVAYDYLKAQKRSIPFKELWSVVKDECGFDDKQAQRKISQFYTDLSLDGRFTSLENNEWDLKSNHKFDEVFIDSSSLMDDSDEEGTIIDDELELNSTDVDDYQ